MHVLAPHQLSEQSSTVWGVNEGEQFCVEDRGERAESDGEYEGGFGSRCWTTRNRDVRETITKTLAGPGHRHLLGGQLLPTRGRCITGKNDFRPAM